MTGVPRFSNLNLLATVLVMRAYRRWCCGSDWLGALICVLLMRQVVSVMLAVIEVMLVGIAGEHFLLSMSTVY